MELSYQVINGSEYAKVPGSSFRVDGKIRKKNVIYLGRVIDKEHNVFYNRKRGIFIYDPETDTYGKADETYVSNERKDRRKKEHFVLDFGDSFFIDSLIRSIGYDKVLDSIPYKNRDTLYAMVQYYILSNSANSHAHIWYDGSFARLLYPRADLTSQRISDFLETIGDYEKVSAFFDAHIQWIKEKICADPAILLDSTGLPNEIHIPLTAYSNHNGVVSHEVRLTMMVQRDSGMPLIFRATPGNIIDLSTITRTVNDLSMRDMKTDFVIMDAGYFTDSNIEELYACDIDFLTRLKPNFTVYKDIVRENLKKLKSSENLVKYKDRYVYIKQVECHIGIKKHVAYAYLGYDVDRASDESHKVLKNALKNHESTSDLHKDLEKTGLFMIISSLPFEPEDILPAYYTRELIEQYFNTSKEDSKLVPLRVHGIEALYGHLMLSMIAATINIYIQNKTSHIYDDKEAIYMTLRNQKCVAHQSRVTDTEPQKMANEFYATFNVTCPLYFERTDKGLVPKYHLPKPGSDQV